jgi:DNA-binding MarR family transcriptional regulator
MTKILKKLQGKGYIRRISSKKDKRSLLVELTSEGVSITEKSLELFFKKDTEAFKVLDDEEQKVLFKILKKLVYSVVEKRVQ